METMKREAPFDLTDITLVCDNHSAHKSHLFKTWIQDNKVQLLFLPVYSSTLSPVERVWAMFKNRWAKAISKVQVKYCNAGLEKDLKVILEQLRKDLRPKIDEKVGTSNLSDKF